MDDDTKKTKLWNTSLTSISIINLMILGFYCYSNRNSFTTKKIKLTSLTSIFVIVCAIRSIWPRCDSNKLCFYNNIISSPLLGRGLATIAEISFSTLLVLITSIIIKDVGNSSRLNLNWLNMYNWLLVPLIIIAQVCSWSGIITTDSLWNALEESIWAFFGISKAIIYSIIYFTILFRTIKSSKILHLQSIIPFIIAISLMYFYFMVTVDIPMYISRSKFHNGKYLNLKDGISDLSVCRKVSKSMKDWKEDIPWLSLYFSIAVWISLGVLFWYNYYINLK